MIKINPVKTINSGSFVGPLTYKPKKINIEKLSLAIPEAEVLHEFNPFEVVKSLNEMGIRNLRVNGVQTISGETLEHKPEALIALKNMGVTTVVDLRADQKTQYKDLCESKGLKYFSFPLQNSYVNKDQVENPQDFAEKLNQLFYIVNNEASYMACNYGIDRTNIALTLNYLLNPKQQYVPEILTWYDKTKKSIINGLYKQVKKILKAIPIEVKHKIGISQNTENDLHYKVSKMNKKNNEY